MLFRRAVLILLLAVPFVGLHAANYWPTWGSVTKYAAMSGGSGTACTSSAPCTIAYAFANAKPGDVWQVAPGTDALGANYIALSASGTSSSPIVFTCATPASWVWDGTATGATCNFTSTATSPGPGAVMQLNGSYIVLDGFNLSNLDTSGGVDQIIYLQGGHDTVSRSVLHDATPACNSVGGGGVQVAVGSPGYDVFDANVVYNFGTSACLGSYIQYKGFLCEEAGGNSNGGSSTLRNCTVTNNIIFNFHGGPAIGMSWGGGSGNAVAANNLLFSDGNSGILYGDGTVGIFPNNIIINIGGDIGLQSPNGAYYGCCSGSLGATVTDNVFYDNTPGNFEYHRVSGRFTQSGNISADPAAGMFVNWQTNGTGNYHSASGSPLIGAGTSTGAPNHDFDGNMRSRSYDIGPYQDQSGSGRTNYSFTRTNATGTISNGTNRLGAALEMLLAVLALLLLARFIHSLQSRRNYW